MQFGMAPLHHNRDYHSPHHSRSRDGVERSSTREFDSYLDNNKDRDRGRDRWRDREHEKERDSRFKDKDQQRGGRDYDNNKDSRDSRREREPYMERNGHGSVGGRPGMVGGFDGRPGSRDREIHGSRDEREDRHGSAGLPFVVLHASDACRPS